MKFSGSTIAHGGQYPDLLFINGTDTHKSYVVVARRGCVFLGIKLSGLTDGSKFGAPGKTYLHARVRSARDQALVKELDLQSDPGNVVSLVEKQLALDEAWPNLPFEKVDNDRASLHVGAFVQGSLVADAAAVVARIEQGDLFRKLVGYVAEQAGPSNCIAPPKTVAAWMASQAEPMLHALKNAIEQQKLIQESQQAFAALIEAGPETVAPHTQLLQAIYKKHQQASGKAALAQSGAAADQGE